MNLDSLSRLKPVFKKDGTVTAGNASGINDGAAAVTLMSGEEAEKRSLKKLVEIKSWASCGVEPSLMGTGPIPSTKKALDLAGWTVKDVDLLKSETFALRFSCIKHSIPIEKVNVNGGAIALGHQLVHQGQKFSTDTRNDQKRCQKRFSDSLYRWWNGYCNVLKDKYHLLMDLPVIKS